MPRIAPLTITPDETPRGIVSPHNRLVWCQPNISSTTTTSATGQPTTASARRPHRGMVRPRGSKAGPSALMPRSDARGQTRLAGRDLVDLVAAAAAQRDVGTRL